jgi:protein TonB
MLRMSGTTPRESNGWGLIIGLVFASGVAHALTIIAMPDRPWVEAKKPVEMEFYEPPPPPPPPKEEEPPKPLEPPKVIIKPPPVKVAELKPPPKNEPPPPNQEPPPDAKPAPIVIGVTMDSTTAAGGFAVQVGNTTYGKASDKVVDPNSVKPYSAPKYAPPGGADTEPQLIGEIKVTYPEEAKKNEIEGTVRLKVTLSPEGIVENVVVINGPGYGLNEAALGALKRFKFKPATKGGEAVGYTFIYSYTFLLD